MAVECLPMFVYCRVLNIGHTSFVRSLNPSLFTSSAATYQKPTSKTFDTRSNDSTSYYRNRSENLIPPVTSSYRRIANNSWRTIGSADILFESNPKEEIITQLT